MNNDELKRMKIIMREEDMPFFTDEQLEFYIKENNGDIDKAIYECLIIKSESTSVNLPGFSAGDTSSYFKRLAQKYKPNNSCIL